MQKYFNRRKGAGQHWLDLPIVSSQYHISLTAIKRQVEAEIYISDNKELFNTFFGKKDAIENDLGFSMVWQLLPEKRQAELS